MARFDQSRLQHVQRLLRKFHKLKFDRDMPQKLQRADYMVRRQRKAAVCVSMCNVEDQASLLFTLRSQHVGSHAGQVSFPGGHIDANETAEQAALRELKEETKLNGVSFGEKSEWHDVRAVTGTMVTPVLCFIPEDLTKEQVEKAAQVSVEVERCFSVPVHELVKDSVRSTETYDGRWEMPKFQVDKYPLIWGLTAFFLDGIMHDFLAPAFQLDYPKTTLPSKPH